MLNSIPSLRLLLLFDAAVNPNQLPNETHPHLQFEIEWLHAQGSWVRFALDPLSLLALRWSLDMNL